MNRILKTLRENEKRGEAITFFNERIPGYTLCVLRKNRESTVKQGRAILKQMIEAYKERTGRAVFTHSSRLHIFTFFKHGEEV